MASTQDVLDQDRNYIISQAQELQNRATERAWNAQQRRVQAQAAVDEQIDPMVQGNGGYRPEEAAGILQQDLRTGSMATDGQLNSNYLSDAEGAAIQGNPNAAFDYFDPNGFYDTLSTGTAGRDAALAGLKSDYADAINPDAEGYAVQSLKDPNSVVDRTRLTQDRAAADAIRMTPEEQQNIVTSAGISAGAGYRAATDRLQRDARAAGVDPTGAAALSADFERQAAAEGGDAMTKARVAADDAAANRNMSLEQQRIAAEQGYTSAAGSAINAANAAKIQQETQRAGSQQTIAGQKAAAASDVGHLADTQASGQQTAELGTRQYLQDTGMGAAKAADDTSSARSTTLATNRQGVSQGNQATKFEQGYNTAGALSDANQTVADARKQDQTIGLSQLVHKADTENANEQADYDRQSGLYTGRGSLESGNTGQQMQWNSRPSTWQKLAGAAIGAAGAYFGGGKAEGGVVNKPTMAMIGENGPEAVIPLNAGPNAQVRPGAMAGGYGPRVPSNPPTPAGTPQVAESPNYLGTSGGAIPQQSAPPAMPGSYLPAPQAQPGAGMQGMAAGQTPNSNGGALAPQAPVAPTGQTYGQMVGQPQPRTFKTTGQKPQASAQERGYGSSAWLDRSAAQQKRKVGGYQPQTAMA